MVSASIEGYNVTLHRVYAVLVILFKFSHSILLAVSYFSFVRTNSSFPNPGIENQYELATGGTWVAFICLALPFYLWSFLSPEPLCDAVSRIRIGGVFDFLLASLPAFVIETSLVWDIGFAVPVQAASYILSALVTLIACGHTWIFLAASLISCVKRLFQPRKTSQRPLDISNEPTASPYMLQIRPPPYPKAPSMPPSPRGNLSLCSPATPCPYSTTNSFEDPTPASPYKAHAHAHAATLARGSLPPGPPSTASSVSSGSPRRSVPSSKGSGTDFGRSYRGFAAGVGGGGGGGGAAAGDVGDVRRTRPMSPVRNGTRRAAFQPPAEGFADL